jgi:SAM-dependent methyltransferase
MISKIIQTAAAVGQDWVDGEYYDDAERGMDQQWNDLIWPIIGGSDFSTVLELAPGHGRNTAKLLPLAGHVYAVDINQTNVEFLNKRFEGVNKFTAIGNGGAELDEIDNATVTFVYCFDAMVHFDSDVVRSYIKEFRRVMKPGARAFVHYSANDKNPSGSYRDDPGWRNFMSPAFFHHWLAKEGFVILRAEYVSHVRELCEKRDGADAITYFELPSDAEPSVAERPTVAEGTHQQLRAQIRENEVRIRHLDARIRDMESSASWRWTAPMRRILDAFRK